jgi:NADH-quinone oxidoreductase subunit J
MSVVELIFYAFSALLIGAAVMVISVRNPVYAALALVLAFFSSAAIWLLLQVEFLAIVLILVYVGAVMVLFLFVVMMLDINVAPLKEGFIRYLPAGIAVAAVMAGEFLLVLWSRGKFGPEAFPVPEPVPLDYNNTQAIGEWMYTRFLLPFEVAGIILLVAIIAAIALTLRDRPGVKRQVPYRQVMVQRDERIRIASMDTEPTPSKDQDF